MQDTHHEPLLQARYGCLLKEAKKEFQDVIAKQFIPFEINILSGDTFEIIVSHDNVTTWVHVSPF